jgi:predicted MFS family arabinose efflux permease
MEMTRDVARESLQREVLIALGLSIGAAVALGFSRFAYALLLPPMRDTLGLTYVEAGALNTANAVGYIFGSLAAALSARRWGAKRPFQLGFLVSALILALSAAASDFRMLFLLRTIGGVSTAFAFILGAALAGAICPGSSAERKGFLVGLYVAGSSLGIVVSGIAVPFALQEGPQGWREGWVILGCLALLGAVPAALAARSVPAPAKGASAMLGLAEFRRLTPAILGYGLFGAGYVGWMTFIIALLRNQGASGEQTSAFWIVLGLTSTISTLLWGRVLAQLPGGRGPALIFFITMLGTLPVLIQPGLFSAFLSAVVFGSSFMAGPAAVTILAQRQLPASALTAAVALLTVAFALGQSIGPILAGTITDMTGQVAAGLWASPALLGLAAIVSLFQRRAG